MTIDADAHTSASSPTRVDSPTVDAPSTPAPAATLLTGQTTTTTSSAMIRLPPLPAKDLISHVPTFSEQLTDASSFEKWHGVLLMHARCYIGVFEGRDRTTYGATDDNIFAAADYAAEQTILRSLSETVKQSLVPWNSTTNLYQQLLQLYGVTGIARDLAIFAAYFRQPVTTAQADLTRLEADMPRRHADFCRLMAALGNDASVLQKLVVLDNLPAPFQSHVVRHLETKHASVRDLPNLHQLMTFIRAHAASDQPQANTAAQVNTAAPTAPPARRGARPPPPGPCRFCGKTGHRHSDCPKIQHLVHVNQTSVHHPIVNAVASASTRDFIWDGG